MAVNVGELVATIVADTSQFSRELPQKMEGALRKAEGSVRDAQDRVNRRARDFGVATGKSVGEGMTSHLSGVGKRLAAGLGAAFAGAQIGHFLADSVNAASDLSESMNKVNVVFGKSAGAVAAWANDSSKNILMTKQAGLEATGTLGNLFVSMGLGSAKAAGMSTKMVGLANDLSSFNNVGTDEALNAIRAALVGETEPMRAFGSNISAARIEAEALDAGLVKNVKNAPAIAAANARVRESVSKLAEATRKHGKNSVEAQKASGQLGLAEQALAKATKGKVPELTAAQKAQAAYNLILDDTKTAQGDAARTSTGYANQTRILQKQIGDLKTGIGAALLPTVNRLLIWITGKIMPAFQQLVQKHGPAVERFFARVGTVIASVASDFGPAFVAALRAAGDKLGELFSKLSAGGGGGDTLDKLRQAAEKIGPALANLDTTTFADAWNVFGAAIGFVADHLDTVVKYLPLIAAAFVAVKTAQAAANVAAAAAIPLRIAELGATMASARANRALAFQLQAITGAQQRSRVATIASAVASKTATAATKIFTLAQKALSLVLRLNPIGLVITALTLLVVGFIAAYKKSETFRNIVNRAFSSILRVVARLAEGAAGMFRALSHVPGFGWAKTAANALDGAAKKARALADSINDIPSKKAVTVTTTYQSFQKNAGMSAREAKTAAAAARRHEAEHGGSVWPRQPTLVGERGPELLVPAAQATVVPNYRLGQSGPAVVQNIYTDEAMSPDALMRAAAFRLRTAVS